MLDRIIHWLLGPEENFGNAMNTRPVPTTAKLLLCLLLAGAGVVITQVVCSWAVHFFGPQSIPNTSPNATTTSETATVTSPCGVAVAGDNHGNISPNCINTVATYTLTSRNWTAEPLQPLPIYKGRGPNALRTSPEEIAANAAARTVTLGFTASQALPPKVSCFTASSDIDIDSVIMVLPFAGGTSSGYLPSSGLPSKNYTQCISTAGVTNIGFTLDFASTPTVVNASLKAQAIN